MSTERSAELSANGTILSGFPEPLSAAAIAPHLRAADLKVEAVATTGSTNADLMARARERAFRSPVLRVAGTQTGGRGRLGRRWLDGGASLLFSLGLPWRKDPASTPEVTLACGLAAAEALHARGIHVGLKWPNDLLLDGRKLAGILCEMAEDPAGGRSLIIGMGVNLILPAALRDGIDQPVAELAERVPPDRLLAERAWWLGRFADAMLAAARRFEHVGEGAP